MAADAKILALIRKSERANGADGCVTTPELAKALDCGEARARRIVRDLIGEGKLEPTRTVRLNMAGVPHTRVAYRIVDDA